MNLMLNHILENDLITEMLDKPSKIIYLYNSRHIFNHQWFKILFTPLPIELQNIVNTLYNCELFFNLPYEVVTRVEKENIKKFNDDLEKKSFILYLYDSNYLNLEWLELFSNEQEISKTYVLNYKLLYFHDQNLKHRNLEKVIRNNIKKYKDCKLKYILLFKKDLDTENIVYKEMIKIGDTWKIFTTKYCKKENYKNIVWIFAENINDDKNYF